MSLLLDTHAFLWFILDDQRLSRRVRALIVDPDQEILVSPAACWEIAIKVSIGKYQLPGPLESFLRQQIEQNDFDVLPIELPHIARVAVMPFHHRDPFDRLLAAQALVESVPIASADSALDVYGVARIW